MLALVGDCEHSLDSQSNCRILSFSHFRPLPGTVAFPIIRLGSATLRWFVEKWPDGASSQK